MRSSRQLLCFGTLIGFALSTTLASQTGPGASPTRAFSSHVYAWFPDNTVRRLSPGPASSPSAAMPAGPFTQADIHPEGTAAVFWGGFDARPRVWLYDFAMKSARPLTADNVGSLEPSFDWQGRRIVFAADIATASAAEISAGPGSWRRSNMNLFVMDADGSNLRQVTEGAFQDSRPAFSPDGTMIVFLSNRDGSNRQLYVVTGRSFRSTAAAVTRHSHRSPVVFVGRQVYLLHLRKPAIQGRADSNLANSRRRWSDGADHA